MKIEIENSGAQTRIPVREVDTLSFRLIIVDLKPDWQENGKGLSLAVWNLVCPEEWECLNFTRRGTFESSLKKPLDLLNSRTRRLQTLTQILMEHRCIDFSDSSVRRLPLP